MSIKSLLGEQKNHLNISNRVYYEITSFCNLKCMHCSDLLSTSSTFLDADKLIAFHKEMTKLGVNSSVVTGGEPTLHKEFARIVSELAQLGPVLITTNATLINPQETAGLLKSNGNIALQISMDGADKNVFEEIRGEGTFDKVSGLIDFLLKEGLNKQVGISMTILSRNIDQVKEMLKYAVEKRLSFVHFPTLLPIGAAMNKWDMVAPSVDRQIAIEEYILNEMINEANNLEVSCNRVDQVLTRVTHGIQGDCLRNYTLKVNPEGYILPCPASSDTSLSLGSIDEEGIADSIMERLHNKYDEYVSHIGDELTNCSNCQVSEYCNSRFCANCGILRSPHKQSAEQNCAIFRHHYLNAQKEIYNGQ